MLGEIIGVDLDNNTITLEGANGTPVTLNVDDRSATTRAAVQALGKNGAQKVVNALVERQLAEREKAASGKEHLIDVESLALRILIKEIHGI